jgi:hypothetical protein
VKRGFSPLDEELELLPGSLTPSLGEQLVRLGTWMPFGQAAKLLGDFWKVPVSEPTARRRTEQAGAAYAAVQTAEVERLEREVPEPPAGPAIQQLSVDGAMVPLVGGTWGEVKLLAIGTVQPAVLEAGKSVVHTRELSYFGRMTDHKTFRRLALVETQRRGTERAGRVCAVVDGAEWQQGFIDLHRPDAVRILDFPHGAKYVAEAGQAVLGGGREAPAGWLAERLHDLKHGNEDAVLVVLGELRKGAAAAGNSAAEAVVATSLSYLEKRREQIRYSVFQAQGYPIGSGAVESGNKLVTEARLKGAGMHWAPRHVDPMVALRTVVCADRWEEAWGQISPQLLAAAHEQTRTRRAARDQARAPVADATAAAASAVAVTPAVVASAPLGPEPPDDEVPSNLTVPAPLGAAGLAPNPTPAPPTPVGLPPASGGRRPALNHPWRRQFLEPARRDQVAS